MISKSSPMLNSDLKITQAIQTHPIDLKILICNRMIPYENILKWFLNRLGEFRAIPCTKSVTRATLIFLSRCHSQNLIDHPLSLEVSENLDLQPDDTV